MNGLGEIRTPALLLDADRLRANVAAMTRVAARAGVPLRVHLKTAKCLEAAAQLADAGVARFAVSTVAEAEFFAAAGYGDILYTTPVTPAKVPALLTAGAMGVIESLPMARAVEIAARDASLPLPVLIELDVDGIRGGVPFPGPDFEALAAFAMQAEGLTLRGAMTYSGATYNAPEAAEKARIAADHDAALARAGEHLRALGVSEPILSTGGSPGVLAAPRPTGATEFRPGVFVFWDLYQAGIGACREEDIAISVLATVLSVRPERGTALTDAGALALSLDRSTAKLWTDWGLGRVCDETGRPLGALRVIGSSQEHGVLGGDDTALRALQPGQLVRILPNHCCLTAAAYPDYVVLEGGRPSGARWRRVNFW
jgi:D-serine deaminase-like pyridoxal phosphate-dependent protein